MIEQKRIESLAAIETMKSLAGDRDSPVLLPLGGGTMVRAKVSDPEKILVNIGSDVVIQRTNGEAVTFLQEKITEMEAMEKKVAATIDQLEEPDGRDRTADRDNLRPATEKPGLGHVRRPEERAPLGPGGLRDEHRGSLHPSGRRCPAREGRAGPCRAGEDPCHRPRARSHRKADPGPAPGARDGPPGERCRPPGDRRDPAAGPGEARRKAPEHRGRGRVSHPLGAQGCHRPGSRGGIRSRRLHPRLTPGR